MMPSLIATVPTCSPHAVYKNLLLQMQQIQILHDERGMCRTSLASTTVAVFHIPLLDAAVDGGSITDDM